MKDLILALLVGAFITNTVPLLAMLYGLSFTVTNPSCKEEVEGVKKNIRSLKIFYIITASLIIAAAIILLITL